MGVVPRQVNASQELAHPPFDLDYLPQSIRFRRADISRITHLRKKLCDDIIVILDLDSQERRANEVLQGVDDSVQELED